MRETTIGELEELVLLAVGALYNDQAYAITILALVTEETGRILDVTAVHAVLRRLESKGLVTSHMGGATAERGGRRKRFFSLTQAGRAIIEEVMTARMNLYNKLPRLTFSGF
jgi:DNA-binding MarR family transcriptional regulator